MTYPSSREQLEFEIAFYEKLLSEKPDYTDALIPLAEAYTRRGDLEKGLKIDLKLTRLKKDDPVVWYNLSCSYSLLQRIDEACEALQKAVQFGYDDIKHLKQDTDLYNLRNSAKFKSILKAIDQQNSPSTP